MLTFVILLTFPKATHQDLIWLISRIVPLLFVIILPEYYVVYAAVSPFASLFTSSASAAFLNINFVFPVFALSVFSSLIIFCTTTLFSLHHRRMFCALCMTCPNIPFWSLWVIQVFHGWVTSPSHNRQTGGSGTLESCLHLPTVTNGMTPVTVTKSLFRHAHSFQLNANLSVRQKLICDANKFLRKVKCTKISLGAALR